MADEAARRVKRFPSVPYVAPFAVFVALLSLHAVLPVQDLALQILQLAIPALTLFLFSRGAVDFRVHVLRRIASGSVDQHGLVGEPPVAMTRAADARYRIGA